MVSHIKNLIGFYNAVLNTSFVGSDCRLPWQPRHSIGSKVVFHKDIEKVCLFVDEQFWLFLYFCVFFMYEWLYFCVVKLSMTSHGDVTMHKLSFWLSDFGEIV